MAKSLPLTPLNVTLLGIRSLRRPTKDLAMRSFWTEEWTLNSTTGVLIREEQRTTGTEPQ